MNDQMKKKIITIELVILIILSASVGYILIKSNPKTSKDKNKNEQNNLHIQEVIINTGNTPSPIQAHIEAGPLIGYNPLVVSFYGNAENDSNIDTYYWDFGPTTKPIIPQTQYKKLPFSFFLVFVLTFLCFPLSMAYVILYQIISMFRYKSSSQYESTERNPTMVFLSPGSYSATLTVTDKQGNTSSDIVWITVLQYFYPDYHD